MGDNDSSKRSRGKRYLFIAVVLVALLLAAVLAGVYPYFSRQAQTLVATVTLGGASPQGVAYSVYLFRYVDRPTLVAKATLRPGQTVSLHDFGLTSIFVDQPNIHYSILVVEELANGSVAQIADYHWSAPAKIVPTSVGATINRTAKIVLDRLNDSYTELKVNGAVVAYRLAQTAGSPNQAGSDAWPTTTIKGAGSPTSIPENSTQIQPSGAWYTWVPVGSWYAWTTIGEATSWKGLSTVYTITSLAVVSVTALSSVDGGPWAIVGGVNLSMGTRGMSGGHIFQFFASITDTLSLGDGNYYAQTELHYEEDQLYRCTNGGCTPEDIYQMYFSGWLGGFIGWQQAGKSQSKPGSGLNSSQIEKGGYSCTVLAPGGILRAVVSNGYVYQDAATISQGIRGTQYPAVFSLTTEYQRGVILTIMANNAPNVSFYYVYTDGHYPGLPWPVYFSSAGNEDSC